MNATSFYTTDVDYIKILHTQCYNRYVSFDSIEEAKNSCSYDNRCGGVYVPYCSDSSCSVLLYKIGSDCQLIPDTADYIYEKIGIVISIHLLGYLINFSLLLTFVDILTLFHRFFLFKW